MTRTERMHEPLVVALAIALVIGICVLDMALATEASIVALYVIPILLSLLSAEQWFTLAMTSITLSLATLGFLSVPSDGPSGWAAPINHALALLTVTAVACLALFYRRLVEGEKAALARRREHAVAPIRVLRGLLPICSSCKNIRDDNGCWIYLETYIEARSDAHFTHGLCPECEKQLSDSLLRRDVEKHDEPLLTR